MLVAMFALLVVIILLFIAICTHFGKGKIWGTIRRMLIIAVCVYFLLFVVFGNAQANLYFGYVGVNHPCNFGINGWDTTWIIWSNPLVGSNITARDLIINAHNMPLGMGTDILVVTNLNSTTMLYNSYVVGDPERLNFKLEDGKGYWLWTYDSGWIPTVGWPTNHSLNVSLKQGWNLIGINTWYNRTGWTDGIWAHNLLAKNSNLLVVSKMYYDGGMGDHTPVWKSYVRGDPINKYNPAQWLGIGSGVYVWAEQNCTITW